jgi:hypothetical protein
VLLKVLLMCACPWETFFFSLRRGLRADEAAALFWGGMCRVLLLAGPSVCVLEGVPPRRWGRGGPPNYFLPAFFLPATVRLGPLRVRALVLVR